ncbi:UDP-GlcNAc:undecaprenyl-phosphate/decaprenyl-phosphate GlcNAc-1-phosphate transferase [Gammaproteobacteria bacterium]
MDELQIVLIAFSISSVLILSLHPIAKRIGLVDVPGGRKHHSREVPLIGGISIFVSFIAALYFADLHYPGMESLLTGALLLVILGVLDDFYELSAWFRFTSQVVVALLVYFLGGKTIENVGSVFGGDNLHLGIFAVPFTIFSMVGIINALNMIDGVDGLAGSLSLVALAFFAVFANLSDRHPTLMVLAVLSAAVTAFLLFNLRLPGRPYAMVFMGDAGSMFLGFTLCWFAIGLSQGNDRVMAPVTALWILAVPVFDTLSAMMRRVLGGASPFTADRGHLHHILMRRLQENQHNVQITVGVILFLATALGLIGMLLEKLQVPETLSLSLLLVCFVGYFRFVLVSHQEKRDTRLISRQAGEPEN